MTRLSAVGALCALGLFTVPVYAAAAPHMAATSSIPSGWVATATQATLPTGLSADLGRVPDSMPMHVVVGLRMRDQSGAEALVRRQHTPGDAMFHRTLTPEEFTARFNPTRAQVEAVVRFLSAHGFTNVIAASNNLVVGAYAQASAVEAAFKTEIHFYRQSLGPQTRVVYANRSAALVPAHLRGTVLGVLGLHNMPMVSHLRRAPVALDRRLATLQHSGGMQSDGKPRSQPCLLPAQNGVCSREYAPYDFQAAYDGLKAPRASRVSIAIFAEGDVAQVPIDLATYQQTFAENQRFPVTVVPVGAPSSDTSGQDEFDLDTQTSTAIAGTVKHLYIYDTTSLSDSDTTLEFNQFVVDLKAQAGSASFGEPEAVANEDSAMLVDDQIFNEAAAQGQTVFASAGDNGAACPVIIATGVPFVPGVVGVCYPASSPYVVGVGGTSLMTDQNTSAYGGEIGWQGTGGGQSAFESPASWTKAVVPAQLSGNGLLRTVPDISMDADNNLSPAIVIVSGTATGVGGTSLSSPLSLGVWARLLSDHPGAFGSKAPFGFAAPAFYYEYAQFPYPNPPPPPQGPPGFETGVIGGYHDIELGSNGLWTGLPAYDNMTGMGTFDIAVQMPDIDLPGAP